RTYHSPCYDLEALLHRRFALAATLALALLACLSAGEAQQAGKVTRVGFLYFGSREPGPVAARYAAFLEGLRELGYVEGKDIVVEPGFAESNPERLPAVVAALLSLYVDSIAARVSTVYRVLQRTTTALPVVATVTADHFLEGLATSLARPGGDFTGLPDTAADLSPKQLELLRSVLPRLARVGVL